MQNEAEVLLVLFVSFPVTFSQQNRLKSVGKVQRVAKLGDILLTMVYFQSLVRGEIVYQNQRINENLEDIIVKDVNQHLYSTHTKYEQKQTNTKVVWCIHGKNLGLDPLTTLAQSVPSKGDRLEEPRAHRASRLRIARKVVPASFNYVR